MSQSHIELTILSNLISNESYARKVIPFLKSEYFSKPSERLVFDEIFKFITDYNALPTKEALIINLGGLTKIRDNELTEAIEVVNETADNKEKSEENWLLNTTEKFCRDKAIYNAVYQSIQILDDKDKLHERGVIPEMLSTALGVSFESRIGHDYLENSDARFDFYHKKEAKIPFDVDYLNKITNDGIPSKTLNIIMGGIHVGKTMMMCHLAAANLAMGYNVLYITLEMSEEEIAKRIDANLLNVPLDDLMSIPKEIYQERMEGVRSKTSGKLIIHEYATASAGALHFKRTIDELFLKKNFKPHVIYIDYINLCLSSRIRAGANVNSYTYVKAIAEEIRGLANSTDTRIWSATQLNRTGFTDSDPGLEDTAESFGLPAVTDFTIVLVASDEMTAMNQIMIKQLKNRYRDMNKDKKFVLGVDKPKQRLFDLDPSAQKNISGSNQTKNSKNKFAGGRNGEPAPDVDGAVGSEDAAFKKLMDKTKARPDFSGFKV